MAVLTEGVRNAEFIISESNGHRSRDQVSVRVAAGVTVPPGAILGYVTGTTKYVHRLQGQADNAGGVAKGILYEGIDNSAGAGQVDVTRTIINADAEVQGETLDANDGVDATVRAELLVLGIKVRGSIGNVA
jgi:hypothetical protein